uniref:Uncharacterized protein n=1 Tax=Rhizophora mucronata TaxID=61149 RepID=A0A2P2IUK8_RHIMU
MHLNYCHSKRKSKTLISCSWNRSKL